MPILNQRFGRDFGARNKHGGRVFVFAMPRYFFDIHDGAHFTTDDTGMELDGIEAAQEEAGCTLGGIARDLLQDGRPHEVVIEVKDEAGQRVLVAKLSATVERTELPGFSPTE